MLYQKFFINIDNVSYDAINGAKVCFKNSKRLLEDSRFVSKPTKYALLAIAMEEVAKGYMILFGSDLFIDNKGNIENSVAAIVNDIKKRPNTDNICSSLKECEIKLKEIIIPIEYKQLKNHKIKFDYIKKIIDFQRLVFIILQNYNLLNADAQATQIVKKQLFGDFYTHFKGFIKKSFGEDGVDFENMIHDVEQATSLIDSIMASMPDLDTSELKKRGLYVDIEKQRKVFISPENNKFPRISTVRRIIDYLIITLEIEISYFVFVIKTLNKQNKEAQRFYELITKSNHYFSIRDYNLALKYIDKAIKVKPSADALYNKGIILRALSRYKKAINAFNKAKELGFAPAQINYTVAQIFSLMHDKVNTINMLIETKKQNATLLNSATTEKDFEWLYKDADFKKIIDIT